MPAKIKATAMLKRQHREVEALFAAAKKATAPRERRSTLDQIEEKLRMHMQIEEQIFYPAVAGRTTHKKVRDLMPEAYEEHHVVKLVLNELPDVDPTDERFEAKVTVLAELVEHHVEEEEKEMFPGAEKDLEAGELVELAERMQAVMDGEDAAQLEQSARPDSPESDDDDDEDDDLDDDDDDDDADEDEDEEEDDDEGKKKVEASTAGEMPRNELRGGRAAR